MMDKWFYDENGNLLNVWCAHIFSVEEKKRFLEDFGLWWTKQGSSIDRKVDTEKDIQSLKDICDICYEKGINLNDVRVEVMVDPDPYEGYDREYIGLTYTDKATEEDEIQSVEEQFNYHYQNRFNRLMSLKNDAAQFGFDLVEKSKENN